MTAGAPVLAPAGMALMWCRVSRGVVRRIGDLAWCFLEARIRREGQKVRE